jgi:hypothetical protein
VTSDVGSWLVGIRAVTGPRAGRLTWVGLREFQLERGDRVLVRDGVTTWLGETFVPAARIVEAAPLDGLAVVERKDAWPDCRPTAGRQLLASLRLAPDQTRPTRR